MTNELEKQFFNTFNIEPIGCNDNKNCTGALDCTQCPNAKYPQITDRIYLELHCLLNSLDTPPYGFTVKEFKKDIRKDDAFVAAKLGEQLFTAHFGSVAGLPIIYSNKIGKSFSYCSLVNKYFFS